jgi:anti-sigma regulatory factor (Ser/Thr protein kinase)
MEVAEKLPLGYLAPRAARRAVDCLIDLAADVRDMAQLVVSELVTNIVRHSGMATGAPLEVRMILQDERLRIEVAQEGRSAFTPATAMPATDAVAGRGLLVVDRVADRWGTRGNGGLKVWAEFDLPSRQGVA